MKNSEDIKIIIPKRLKKSHREGLYQGNFHQLLLLKIAGFRDNEFEIAFLINHLPTAR